MASQASKELGKVLGSLTQMQRLYVKARAEGMSKVAAATAAGQASPKINAYKFEKSENVKAAIEALNSLVAEEVMFGRREAYEMYMQAYHSATTSAEMTLAVNALVKLFGIAAPEVKELRHQHSGLIEHKQRLEDMPDDELAQLAKLPDDPFLDKAIVEGEFEVVPREDPAEEDKKCLVNERTATPVG